MCFAWADVSPALAISALALLTRRQQHVNRAALPAAAISLEQCGQLQPI